jgi:hypothetical protein
MVFRGMKTVKFIGWCVLGSMFMGLAVALAAFIRSARTMNDVAGYAAIMGIWQTVGLLVALLCCVAGFFLARMLKRRNSSAVEPGS